MQIEAFNTARNKLEELGFDIIHENLEKPWGGYFVIDEQQSIDFIKEFFPKELCDFSISNAKLSPKFLIVKPGKRLSWQYHMRRSEIWTCIHGQAGVIKSLTDEEGPLQTLHAGEKIKLEQGERHRLVGLKDWAIIAEIWIHTDPENPSEEEDIIRLKDDFKRV